MARMKSNGNADTSITSNTRLKQLLINRARIVKNASGKVPLAINLLLREYVGGQSWIIYCDNITQLKKVLNGAIDAGFDAFEYTDEIDGQTARQVLGSTLKKEYRLRKYGSFHTAIELQ